MSSAQRADRARRLVDAQRARMRRQRRAVIAFCAALLIGLSGVVYGQMAAGNDPVVGTDVLRSTTGSSSIPASQTSSGSNGDAVTTRPS